jgi:hypothetical protein
MKFRMVLVAVAVAAIMPVAASAEDGTDKENGARACQALKTRLGEDTFKATYGTNADKSNAFGKCVSKWTHTERKNRQEAATACAAEQADPNFAATHGGKTFDQFYGVGKRGAAAMQSCVKAKRKAASTADRQETLNAAKQCKAERKPDEAAFKAKYGTNADKSNAFGKCVAKLAQAQQDS